MARGMTVLIADDFEEHRLLMRQAVEKRGHRVVEAADGREALEVAERERAAPDSARPGIAGAGRLRRGARDKGDGGRARGVGSGSEVEQLSVAAVFSGPRGLTTACTRPELAYFSSLACP